MPIKKSVKGKKCSFSSINEVLDLAHRLLPFQLYLKLVNVCEKYVKEVSDEEF